MRPEFTRECDVYRGGPGGLNGESDYDKKNDNQAQRGLG